jgi:hypothetical protein
MISPGNSRLFTSSRGCWIDLGKVAGLVATCNQAKKAEAIDAEAEKLAEVQRRHRKEWEQVAAELFRFLWTCAHVKSFLLTDDKGAGSSRLLCVGA